MSPITWILVASAAIAAFAVLVVSRRASARGTSRSEAPACEPPIAESRAELEGSLARALEANDLDEAERIRTKLHVLSYWARKRSRDPEPEARASTSRAAIGEDDVASKRFNNFR